QSELLQPRARAARPEPGVLEAEDAAGPLREPGGGPAGAELENRPVPANPPVQPADRRGNDPRPLWSRSSSRSPPGGRVTCPPGKPTGAPDGAEAPAPLAGVMRSPQRYSGGGHLPASTFFLNERWRRRASRINIGVSPTASRGWPEKKRAT